MATDALSTSNGAGTIDASPKAIGRGEARRDIMGPGFDVEVDLGSCRRLR